MSFSSPRQIPLPSSSPSPPSSSPHASNIPLPPSSSSPHASQIPLPSSSPSPSLPSSPPIPALPRHIRNVPTSPPTNPRHVPTNPPTTPRTSPRPLPPAYIPLPASSSPSEGDDYSPPPALPYQQTPSVSIPQQNRQDPQPFTAPWLTTHLFLPAAEYSLGYIRRTIILNSRNGPHLARMARELTGACWVVGRGLREEQEEEGDIGVKEREIALRRCQEVANMALGLGRTVAAGSKLHALISTEESWAPGLGRHISPPSPVASAEASSSSHRYPRYSAAHATAVFGPAIPPPVTGTSASSVVNAKVLERETETETETEEVSPNTLPRGRGGKRLMDEEASPKAVPRSRGKERERDGVVPRTPSPRLRMTALARRLQEDGDGEGKGIEEGVWTP